MYLHHYIRVCREIQNALREGSDLQESVMSVMSVAKAAKLAIQ